MSAASLRLSWFISNSYSKSEIALSPLSSAPAPCLRAKSTRSVSNTSTSTFSSFSVACRRNSLRSAAVNRVVGLRTGWFTTPTTTRSNTRAARWMMSTWPYVTGSYEPGQTATGPSALFIAVYGDSDIAVSPLPQQGQIDLQRVFDGALANHARLGRESSDELAAQPIPETVGESIGRVAEDQVPALPPASGVAQECQRVGPHDGSVLGPHALEVLPDGVRRGRVRVDERRARRAA